MTFVRMLALAVVLFTIVLFAGTSLANQGSGGGPQPAPRPTIPAPFAVKWTVNEKVCGSHAGPFGSIACSAVHTDLALVFEWKGDRAYSTVDGFDVYEMEDGSNKLVDTNTTQATIGFVKPPADGFGGRCYAVAAVVGKLQSQPSKPVCMPQSWAPVVLSHLSVHRTGPHTAHLTWWSYRGSKSPGFLWDAVQVPAPPATPLPHLFPNRHVPGDARSVDVTIGQPTPRAKNYFTVCWEHSYSACAVVTEKS